MNTIPLLLLLAAVPAAAQSTATLRGVDVYRSRVLPSEKASLAYSDKLKEYVNLRNARRPATDQKAEELRKAIEKEVKALPGVKRVTLTVSEYFTSVDHAMYATFDIVDEEDRDRLAFAPVAGRVLPDPDGLLADWKKYYDLGSLLARRGEMSVDRPDCPGFFCLWGGPTPELAALQQKFVEGAAKKEQYLRSVLSQDADGDKRAAALYVLSYGTRGEKVIESAQASLRDPSPAVRGAAVQILADIVNHRKDLRVDVDKILPLLDDPSGAVRGKTMGLLVPMVDNGSQRKKMLLHAPRLVELLKLKQPENHDLAFTLLGQISHKNFDRHDLVSWESWAAKAAEGKEK